MRASSAASRACSTGWRGSRPCRRRRRALRGGLGGGRHRHHHDALARPPFRWRASGACSPARRAPASGSPSAPGRSSARRGAARPARRRRRAPPARPGRSSSDCATSWLTRLSSTSSTRTSREPSAPGAPASRSMRALSGEGGASARCTAIEHARRRRRPVQRHQLARQAARIGGLADQQHAALAARGQPPGQIRRREPRRFEQACIAQQHARRARRHARVRLGQRLEAAAAAAVAAHQIGHVLAAAAARARHLHLHVVQQRLRRGRGDAVDQRQQQQGRTLAGLALHLDAAAQQRGQPRARSPGRARCRRSAAWSTGRPARRPGTGRRAGLVHADAAVAHRHAHPRAAVGAGLGRAAKTRTSPRSVNFTALPTRVVQDLAQRVRRRRRW